MKISTEVVCAVVATLVYANTFDAELVYDDSRAIVKNRDVTSDSGFYNLFFNDFWGTPMTHSGSHRSYRPITVLTFRLNYAMSGLRPWSYHLTNVILHALTTLLFVILLKKKIFCPTEPEKPLISGLLFAVHPVHTEAVAGVVGRADVLATFFVLATLLTYVKLCDFCDSKVIILSRFERRNESICATKAGRPESCGKTTYFRGKTKLKSRKRSLKGVGGESTDHCVIQQGQTEHQNSYQTPISTVNALGEMTLSWLPYVFALCAMLSKEQGICALPLCAVYDIWLKNQLGIQSAFRVISFQDTDERFRRLRARFWILVASTLSLLALRILPWSYLSAYHHSMAPPFSSSDNPAAASDSALTRALTFQYLLAFNAWILLCPITLSYDWSMESIPLIETLCDARNICTLLFYAFLALILGYATRNLRNRDIGATKINLAVEEKNFSFSKSIRPIREEANYPPNGSPHAGSSMNKNTKKLTTALCIDDVREEGEITSEIAGDSKNKSCHCEDTSRIGQRCNDEIDLRNEHSKTESAKEILEKQLHISFGKTCEFPKKTNSEPTNSSGYATESSVEGLEENWMDDSFSSRSSCDKFAGLHSKPRTNATKKYLQAHVETIGAVKTLKTAPTQSTTLRLRKGRNPDIVLFGLAVVVLPFLPATNLFFYVGFVVAERLLYLPSMGYCLLVGHGTVVLYQKVSTRIKNARARKRYQSIMKASVIMLIAVLAIRTVCRNEDWKNEYRLYRAGVSVSPTKSWANLGNVLKVAGQPRQAEIAYLNALKHRTNSADVHYNLGLLYQEQKRFSEALKKYGDAILYRPTLAVAHLNTGIVLAELKRFKEAETAYRHTAEISDYGLKDPQRHAKAQVSALYNLGCLLASQARHEEAVAVFEEALRRMRDDYEPQSLHNMLGQSLFRLNRMEEAETHFSLALHAKPDHVPAHLTYARLLSRKSRVDEAEQMYKRALRIDPHNHAIYVHFSNFYVGQGEYEKASNVMGEGVKTQGGAEDYDTLMAAANAHRHAKYYEKAEKYYRGAARVKPNEATAHMNLGAILHLQGKYTKARESYLAALSLQPDDETTLSNLAKLAGKALGKI